MPKGSSMDTEYRKLGNSGIARCAAKQVLLGDARQPCFLYG